MLTLTIDGRRVSVEPGSTVLEAAKRIGVRIPTLCHVPGIEPAASCYICAVQIEGRPALSPACATPVSEGMVVRTDSQDVHRARKIALELLLSDHAGECTAPCVALCPAGLDIPGFVAGVAAGDNHHAFELTAERLVLPGSLGRICPRLCEQECRRDAFGRAVAVGALHRYAADLDRAAATPYIPWCAPATGKSVAIVGAGPAGLAAAWRLLQKGHGCTLFDTHPLPGGMLRYGIPAYRLPKDALDAEIEAIKKLGARFRMGSQWGRDFTLAGLRERHDAVFLAIGAQRARALECEGEELALPGTGFLEMLAAGSPPPLGPDVLVVGGGNTALDCARSAVRLGARNVCVLYRRGRNEIPCLAQEVDAAEVEGVRFEFLVAPIRLERSGPRLRLTCRRMTLGSPDGDGRRKPVAVDGSDYTVECSTVISAVGQTVERALAVREGLAVTAWGIAANETTLATNLPGVFAGGDAVLGADLAVRAVAAGKLAAASIHQYLSGVPVAGEPVPFSVTFQPLDDAERAAVFRDIESAGRVRTTEIPLARRLASFDEVDLGLSGEDAAREASRCLSCGCRKTDCSLRALASEYQADPRRFAGARRRFSRDLSHPEVAYEAGKCIGCGVCVQIAAVAREELGMALIGRGFDVVAAVPFGRPLSEGLRQSALRCAAACPTGALSLRAARLPDCFRPVAVETPVFEGDLS
jgi:formate dehydrogenase major subunit